MTKNRKGGNNESRKGRPKLASNDDPSNYRKIKVLGKPGCGFCKMQQKLMVKEKVRNRFVFVKPGTKEYERLRKEAGVIGFPTFISEEKKMRNVGTLGPNGLKQLINEFSVKKRGK